MVVVRVPKHDEVSLSTALDAGAAGFVIPHTETVQDIKDKVKDIFYREYTAHGDSACHWLLTNKPQRPSANAPSAPGPSPPASPTSRSTRATTGT